MAITDDEAIKTARDLARIEGLLVGFSSGANVKAALKLAEQMEEGKVVATLLCDSGLRYLSSDLYELN